MISSFFFGPDSKTLSWLGRFGRFVLFVAIIVVGGWAGTRIERLLHTPAPASDWFVVRPIVVPDHREGVDPAIIVERQIKKPFRADWIAHIRRVQENGLVGICIGRGASDYRPEAILPSPLRLSWWMDRVCFLPPGQYRIDTVWTIQVVGEEDREVRTVSNIFRVLPRTDGG